MKLLPHKTVMGCQRFERHNRVWIAKFDMLILQGFGYLFVDVRNCFEPHPPCIWIDIEVDEKGYSFHADLLYFYQGKLFFQDKIK